MALVIDDNAPCALCGKPVSKPDESIAFPAFLRPGHRFHALSDAVVHSKCFEEWPHHQEFESLYEQYRGIWESRPRDLKTLEEIEKWGQAAFKDF